MDSKRLVTFAVIAFAILFGWQKLFPAPKPVQTQHAVQQQQAVAAKAEAALTAAVPITVTTDTVKAVIDEKSGDLRRVMRTRISSCLTTAKTTLMSRKPNCWMRRATMS